MIGQLKLLSVSLAPVCLFYKSQAPGIYLNQPNYSIPVGLCRTKFLLAYWYSTLWNNPVVNLPMPLQSNQTHKAFF